MNDQEVGSGGGGVWGGRVSLPDRVIGGDRTGVLRSWRALFITARTFFRSMTKIQVTVSKAVYSRAFTRGECRGEPHAPPRHASWHQRGAIRRDARLPAPL
jgi:hypothetical protein